MFVGFELGHAEEIVQHIELVALGELAQSADLFGNESHRFIDTAFSRFLIARTGPRA